MRTGATTALRHEMTTCRAFTYLTRAAATVKVGFIAGVSGLAVIRRVVA